jgi:hypothetical protein
MLAPKLLLPVSTVYSLHSWWAGSHAYVPTTPSSGLLVLSDVVLLWVRLPLCAATGGLQSSLYAPSLRVGLAFSLQFDGWPWNPSLRDYSLPPGILTAAPATTLSHRAAATSLSLSYKVLNAVVPQ